VPHFVSRRPHLNGKHVVFGRVLEGLDALRDVEAVGSADGRTREPVVITDSGINNKL
jgi:cyclophilin family peptidyl-prolyl cis-trans isomerase